MCCSWHQGGSFIPALFYAAETKAGGGWACVWAGSGAAGNIGWLATVPSRHVTLFVPIGKQKLLDSSSPRFGEMLPFLPFAVICVNNTMWNKWCPCLFFGITIALNESFHFHSSRAFVCGCNTILCFFKVSFPMPVVLHHMAVISLWQLSPFRLFTVVHFMITYSYLHLNWIRL